MNVSVLQLGFNLLNGTIPPSIGAMTALQVLDVQSNNLTGCLPSSIGNLTGLSILRLSNNPLNSTLPSTMGQLTKLAYELTVVAHFSCFNLLAVPVITCHPSDWCVFRDLELQFVQMNGSLPTSFTSLTKLT